MEYLKKIFSFVFLLSIIITVPFKFIGLGNADESTIIKSNSNNIYLPLISFPKPITIGGWYEDCIKGVYFDGVGGWIENNTASTIYSVILTINKYNYSTHIYDSFEISPELAATFPNNVNPFYWNNLSSGPYYCWDSDSELDITHWSFYNSHEYQPVNIISVEKDRQGSIYVITGEIRNDQEEAIHGIKVILNPRCSNYQIATVEETSLSPGESTHFSGTRPYSQYDFLNPACGSVDVIGQGYLIP